MKKIRFFVDAHVFDGPFQGSRTYLRGLYSEVFRLLPDVEFFVAASDPSNLQKEFGTLDNVTYLSFFSRNKFLRLLINIPWLIKKYKIDLSHYQYVSPFINPSFTILTIHDILFLDFPDSFPWWFRIKNRFLFRLSASRADSLLTVSEYSASRISAHFKIDRQKIHIIPNGISELNFKTQTDWVDIKSKYTLGKYVLCVSRIEPRKNQSLLIQAFYDLLLFEHGYSLVFVGTKSLNYPELDEILKSLEPGKRGSILFLDNIPDLELLSLYRNCELFVYPSIAEGFGIPPLEAAICGASVICSGKTAMMDFSFFGDRIFDPSSIEDLKSKITRFLEDERSDIQTIQQKISEKYKWRHIAEKFVQIIKGLNP